MFFQRHSAPVGQFLPPLTWTTMEPSVPSCSATLSLSYLAAVEVAPSNSHIFWPLIQVVRRAYLPVHSTRAVFQSLIFQAAIHCSGVQASIRPASAVGLCLLVV